MTRETYGGSAAEAGAKRDQALAKLFYRSGWTQEALAKVEGKPQSWILQALRFGRFLENVATATNSEKTTSKLTERRFRDYWSRTDKAETNERIRFRGVLRLIEESTLAAPRHPAIRKAMVDQFADGKWHAPSTIGAAIGGAVLDGHLIARAS